ncbi:unnamed protein product [Prorocentrum cordatum]|uniref:JmjC domain-containing protein n=1 Tax=Prorocentrum cordatum TaxID=2364126 RepID=A0ABN9XIF5_9DINO|nr:unnamed protein product [Polarella glacialis]
MCLRLRYGACAAAVAVLVCWGFLSLLEWGQPLSTLACWRVAEKQVEAGLAVSSHGKFITVDVEQQLQTAWIALLGAIGAFYLSPSIRLESSWALAAFTQGARDPEGKFCRQLLDYRWLHPSQGGDSFPRVRADHGDVGAWVESCRREFPRLGAEERQLLQPWRSAGAIPAEVLTRPPHDYWAIVLGARAEALPAYAAARLPREELLAHLNASVRSSPMPSLPAGAAPKMLEYFEALDLRQTGRVASTWGAVRAAVLAGEIARFDAGPLFPAELFHVSVRQLAAREGAAARRAVVRSDGCRPVSFAAFAERNAQLVRRGARTAISAARGAAVFGEGSVNALMSNHSREDRQYCSVGYINSRRLGKLHAGLPDLVRGLGLEREVLRQQSFLWMGPVRGGFHYDEEPNVYVQVSGESDLLLIHPDYVKAYSAGLRIRQPPSLAELAKDPFLRRIPMHLFHMKPGEAVTFPGGTYHMILAQTFDRLAVNFFFMPTWRKLEVLDSDWYSSERREPGGNERLALRQLWARTLVRLYEETGKGVIFMGEKLEYL